MSETRDDLTAQLKLAAQRFRRRGSIRDAVQAERYARGLRHNGTPTRFGVHNMKVLVKRSEKLKRGKVG